MIPKIDFLKDFINSTIIQFGGKNDLILLFLISSLSLVVVSFIKNRTARVTSSTFCSLFIVSQLISLFFTQSFISYQFFVHLDIHDIGQTYSLYTEYIFIAFFLLLFIIITLSQSHLICDKLFSERFLVHIKLILILFCCYLIINVESDFISDTKSIFNVLAIESNVKKDDAFFENLQKVGFNDYVEPKNLKSRKGKNIVVISLESFEKGFLSERYSHLTPNIIKLKNSWNYSDIEPTSGSSWTSGSLYTVLTGFPAYFGLERNSIFHNTYRTKIASISSVLKKSGYNSTFVIGDSNFSGTQQMVKTFEFDKIVDKTDIKTAYGSVFGARDLDLFEAAKNEILNKKSPFFLFISTTDTHAPNGIYDSRMEKHITPQKSNFEFTIASVDYMINDFISFLEKENLLATTSVFIFPDHLKMGNPYILEDTGKRSLYLISNETFLSDYDASLYQIDLPKLILNAAGVKHNMMFLTDQIYDKNKESFIKRNSRSLTKINIDGLRISNSVEIVDPDISKKYEKYKRDTSRFIAHAGGQIDGINYTNSKEALDVNYQLGFRMFELDIIETKDKEYVAAHDWLTWQRMTDFKGETPVTKHEFMKNKLFGKLTPMSMEEINEWFISHEDAILVTDKVNNPLKFSKQFIDPSRLIMELFDMDAIRMGLSVPLKSSMASQSVIEGFNLEDIVELKEMGVKDVAISRSFIRGKEKLLNLLKENDINVYAFHVNSLEGIDEDYVVKYEMDNIYGIYADSWSFSE